MNFPLFLVGRLSLFVAYEEGQLGTGGCGRKHAFCFSVLLLMALQPRHHDPS